MSRRLSRFSLLLVFLLSGEVWAIGLGDIRLDSALNEPLRAEIDLLSATPEELAALQVALASGDTFDRYGIDRPYYLTEIEFNVVANGPNGPMVQLRSRSPITEPFLTFLVEATWPSGRLLREYTVLLDPPTYAPPAVQQAPAVEAPRRAAPSDSGRIERQAQPAPQPAPQRAEPRPAVEPPRASEPAPRPAPQAEPQPAAPQAPFDTMSGGDLVVQRGDTLWGIASRMRPDSRLSMNQTMLAIYEANRDAFGGNINLLKAGAAIRVPSADEIFQISRGDALAEVQRQHSQWGTGAGYTAPPQETRPSLQLVPPDEEPAGVAYDDEFGTEEPLTREQEIENRIAELEAADVPDQPSLIEIRDNELASLREELANIRGEVYEPPVEEIVEDFVEDAAEDPFVDAADDEMVDEEAVSADEEAALDDLFPDVEEPVAEDTAADEAEPVTETPTTTVRSEPEPSLVDTIISALTNFWTGIAAALVVVAGLLVWFMRRGRDEVDDSGPWETLDADDLTATGTMSSTETIPAPSTEDESIVVVEQESDIRPVEEDTAEVPVAEAPEDTGTFGSLEDTFSSETAVNLDQTDPIAEADFHMAYGLYDQAADLINGALESEPNDTALMSKLCEIYFVWGNRDAFIDAAGKLKTAVGDGESSEWDKIVIMGQQIAADHALFAGAGVAAATKEMDLSFEAEMDEAGALDMDFGGEDAGAASDVIDLGAAEEGAEDEGVDFLFEEPEDEGGLDMTLEPTAESPTIESPGASATVEMPPIEKTAESPTLEEPAEMPDATSELPSLDEAIPDSTPDAGATAEINLDDLDLDVDGLAETELASLDLDVDETGTHEALEALEALEDTGVNEQLEDTGAVTGKNPEIDPNETGVREGLDLGELDGLDDLDATGEMRLAPDETGASPMLDPLATDEAATDVGIDDSLLDATGLTQVLSDDLAVETAADVDKIIGDDDATMLASVDDALEEGEDEFDFAKTEALPPEAFTGNTDLDETGEMPAVAETDVDLDLDDLTAALQVSAAGDTVEQLRDDATVEQPRPAMSDETSEVPTMSLAPEDMSEDLHEARTMTEVGTKLDLARAYVDMGDPAGARSILEEVLDEGDEGQRQQAQQLLDTLPS